LAEVAFEPQQDQLWVAGDLVNRGPESLAALRFLKHLSDQHPDSLRVVLGNHDLHLLAVYHGAATQYPGDTLSEILAAPDCAELLHWLQQQPLLYTDPSGDYTLVHAGIPPAWSLAQACRYAAEVAAVLRSEQAGDYFKAMYGNYPDRWQEDLSGFDRLRLITNYFTRMRFCRADSQLDLGNKTGSSDQSDFAPWFSHPNRATADQHILFGHWAALEGKANTPNITALDTGCVWGGKLRLMNLESKALHHCSCSEKN
jgi:bis(5'-nucleosyl)-tetraphosphatase (symmetrical)